LPVLIRDYTHELWRGADLISHIAWEVGYENDVVIATIKYEHNDFVNGRRSASPLAKNILGSSAESVGEIIR